jgi:hypothetical protein
MAKSGKKRVVVGSLCKVKQEDKDKGMPNYIQVKDDINLKKGEYIRAESKGFQLENLEKAVAAGKLSEEIAGQIRERIEKIPDWVIAELIILR